MTVAELLQKAMALSERDRVVLMEALEESFTINDQELTPAQRVDLAERLDEFDADPEGTTVDGEKAIGELHARLAKKRLSRGRRKVAR